MNIPNCSICQMINEKNNVDSPVVYCDQQVVLWQNMDIHIPGYFIIAPREHIIDYSKLSHSIVLQLFRVTQKTLIILQQKYAINKVYQCCFSELTPHLHTHLFPRYEWMKTLNATNVNGAIDAPRLFSFVREHYATHDNNEKKAALLRFVTDFKQQSLS